MALIDEAQHMRLQFRDNFDYVHLQLIAVVLVMIGVGSAIYYFGSLYSSRAEVSRVTRSVSMF
jgi:hypothetical protein